MGIVGERNIFKEDIKHRLNPIKENKSEFMITEITNLKMSASI